MDDRDCVWGKYEVPLMDDMIVIVLSSCILILIEEVDGGSISL